METAAKLSSKLQQNLNQKRLQQEQYQQAQQSPKYANGLYQTNPQ